MGRGWSHPRRVVARPEALRRDTRVVAAVGVPPVEEHYSDPPFPAVAGGVNDLLYRDWIEGEYPTGDVLPQRAAQGITAANEQFAYGIGPGCTAEDAEGVAIAQATPPVRIRELCERRDGVDEEGNYQVRCFIESVCTDAFTFGLQGLARSTSCALVPCG
jgi:hypothetical protein